MSTEAPSPVDESEAVNPLDPFGENVRYVHEVIAEMQAPFREAIAKGDGSEPHHAAEIDKLDKMGFRIAFLVRTFGVNEPINPAFVEEMIVQLDKLDHDADREPLSVHWLPQAEAIEAAMQAARAADQAVTEAV